MKIPLAKSSLLKRGKRHFSAKYDSEFIDAIAGFSLAVEGMPIEEVQDEIVNGVAYGWMNCEEEGDWPDKVPYP